MPAVSVRLSNVASVTSLTPVTEKPSLSKPGRRRVLRGNCRSRHRFGLPAVQLLLRLRPYLATEIDANQAKNATKIPEGIVVPSFPTKFGPNAAAIITASHIIEIPREAHISGIL